MSKILSNIIFCPYTTNLSMNIIKQIIYPYIKTKGKPNIFILDEHPIQLELTNQYDLKAIDTYQQFKQYQQNNIFSMTIDVFVNILGKKIISYQQISAVLVFQWNNKIDYLFQNIIYLNQQAMFFLFSNNVKELLYLKTFQINKQLIQFDLQNQIQQLQEQYCEFIGQDEQNYDLNINYQKLINNYQIFCGYDYCFQIDIEQLEQLDDIDYKDSEQVKLYNQYVSNLTEQQRNQNNINYIIGNSINDLIFKEYKESINNITVIFNNQFQLDNYIEYLKYNKRINSSNCIPFDQEQVQNVQIQYIADDQIFIDELFGYVLVISCNPINYYNLLQLSKQKKIHLFKLQSNKIATEQLYYETQILQQQLQFLSQCPNEKLLRFSIIKNNIQVPNDIIQQYNKQLQDIPLLIDNRETRSQHPLNFLTNNINFELTQLKSSDYCIQNIIGFERKDISDLISSLKDKRIFYQSLNQFDIFKHNYLILDVHQQKQQLYNSIILDQDDDSISSLFSIIFQTNMSVIQTSQRDFVETILRISSQYQYDQNSQSLQSSTDNNEHALEKFVTQISFLSHQQKQLLCKKFSNIYELVNSTQEDLQFINEKPNQRTDIALYNLFNNCEQYL